MTVNPQQLLTRYVANVGDLSQLELEPWTLPTGDWGVTVTGESVEYAGRFLYLSDDRRVAVGIERLGPSLLVGTHIGETLYFLAGRVTCRPPGGEPYELRAGDFCYFPPGVEDVWEIEETYVKLFVIQSEEPLPF
jgi:mannose-6-phosphate isomerase-like protein (cupin superfamily)